MPEAQKKLAGKIAWVLLPDAPKFAKTDQEANSMSRKDLKWRAEGDDFRTFLSEFVSVLPQAEV